MNADLTIVQFVLAHADTGTLFDLGSVEGAEDAGGLGAGLVGRAVKQWLLLLGFHYFLIHFNEI